MAPLRITLIRCAIYPHITVWEESVCKEIKRKLGRWQTVADGGGNFKNCGTQRLLETPISGSPRDGT